jgi:hypothetical protein
MVLVGANTLTLRNDTGTDADEPKLTFDNDTFAGANYGNIRTGNGGLQLILESPSTSTFQNRQRILFNSGGSDELSFDLSTDNGSSFTNYFKLDGGNAIFNETGADKDFRVESDTNANGLMLDASTSTVGVNRAANSVVALSINSTATNSSTYALEASNSSSATKFHVRSDGHSAFYKTGNALGFVHNTDGGITTTPDAGGHAVFNEGGVDADFRVESNDNANMLFVDGGGNAVGIGTATPAGTLHVDKDIASGANYGIIQNDGTANTNTIAGWVIRDGTTIMSGIRRRRDGASSPTEIGNFSSDEAVFFLQNNESCLQLNVDGSIVFNEDSLDRDFRVESNDNANALFVDAGNNHIILGGSAIDQAGTFGYNLASDDIRHARPAETAGDTIICAVDGVSNGLQITDDTSNNRVYTFYNAGDQSFSLGMTEAAFNEDGIDRDFRVESDGNTHALFVEGSGKGIAVNSNGTDATGFDSTLKLGGSVSGGGLVAYVQQDNVADGSYIDVNIGNSGINYWTGLLGVNNSAMSSGDTRTQSLISILANNQFVGFNTSVLHTANGSAAASFTVTYVATGTIRITNTSGVSCGISAWFTGGGTQF